MIRRIGTVAFLSVVTAGLIYLWNRKRKYRNILKPKSIKIIKSLKDWEEIFPEIENELKKCPVLGFDCEWSNNGNSVKPVSIIQLSTTSGLCLIIQIQILLKNENCIPKSLTKILKDKRILKVGVACIEDGDRLFKDHKVPCNGCLDLRNVILRCQLSSKIRPGGLKYLSKTVLGVDLSKNMRVRCGDWEREELTEEQIFYAAMDSLVSIKIFEKLIEKHYASDKTTTTTTNRLINDDTTDDNSMLSNIYTPVCQGIVDIKFKNIDCEENDDSKKRHRKKLHRHGNPEIIEIKTTRAYSARKEPLYHNSRLISMDGQLLCTCDERKAKWYIDKGLGEKVCDDPLTVKLLFEPAGRPTSESDYYLQEKDNRCVVCGLPNSYIRKNIIPHEYRKHFPTIYKEHKSHDVVLLCTQCHLLSNQHDLKVKLSLADKYDAKIRSDKYLSLADDVTKIKSAAKALFNDRASNKIPAGRLEELKKYLMEYFAVDHCDDDLIDRAYNMDFEKKVNENYEEHGLKVTNCIMSENGLMEFETMWRQHFLDCMQPAYMPKLWSVHHGHERLRTMLKKQKDEEIVEIKL